ncbi:MAG: recombinase zinc beta ribbon domain-containing protein, partial [Pseudomonadota bacterium]
KNGEQTKNRMRGRLMNGYWCFQSPVGYRYEKQPGHGKLLVRDEPCASIVQEALEGYAAGRFESQAEVKRFLESQPAFPKDLPGGQIRQQRVTDLLARPLYAGMIDLPDWAIPPREGKHDGLISLATYEKIQARRNVLTKAPSRPDIREDFPLRGFVHCSECGYALTSCWSTSSTGVKHPYYLCHHKGCSAYRKSVRRDVVEGAFEDILKRLTPSEKLFELVTTMFRSAWDQRTAQIAEQTAHAQKYIAGLSKQIDALLDRIVEAESPTVISAYEKKIAKLERERLLLADQARSADQPKHSFDEMFELAFGFLANPWKLWESGQLTLRRMVLRLAFAEPAVYDRNTGVRTPKTTIPFNVLGELTMQNCELVRSRRLELPRVLPHSDLNAARLPIP